MKTKPCTLLIFILFIPFSCSLGGISDYYCSFEVTAYYPDYWQIQIPNLPYSNLTRIIFFSVYPNTNGTINTSQINLDRQQQLITDAHAQNTPVSICIGGWGLSDNFSPVAADPAIRTAFIQNLTNYCLSHNFDGVDLDWEPITTQTDRDNFTLLIRELKTALVPHDLTLTVAVMALGSEFHPTAIDSIDRLHVMAYDMTSDPALPHSSYEDSIAALAHWTNFGFDPAKILLGVPFYGRDANWQYHAYKDIVDQYAPAPDIDEVNGIHFNGIDTIQRKTRYVVENNFAGIMYWEATQDTQDHTSLLQAVADQFHLSAPPDFNCDGQVSDLDADHLAQNWLRTDCTAINTWCSAADLDHSSGVNLRDMQLLAARWLTD